MQGCLLFKVQGTGYRVWMDEGCAIRCRVLGLSCRSAGFKRAHFRFRVQMAGSRV